MKVIRNQIEMLNKIAFINGKMNAIATYMYMYSRCYATICPAFQNVN